PPHHDIQRRIANKAFTPRFVAGLEAHIREVANGLVDGFVAAGQVDIQTALADALPGTISCELLGVPVEDRGTYHGWVQAWVGAFGGDPDAQQRSVIALGEFVGYFLRLIEERRAALGVGRALPDDLLS